MFWRFLPSIVIIVFSIWIFCIQTKNSGRFLIALVVISGVFGLIKEVRNYLTDRPTPRLILEDISSHYNKMPPTLAAFQLNIRNTGAAYASEVSIKTSVYCDDDLLLENSKTPTGTIPPGQPIALDLNIGGPTLQLILSGKSQMKIVLTLNYSDEFGRDYSRIETTKFDPNRDSPMFKPLWVRKTK